MSEVPRERLGLLVIRVRLERGGGRLIARITGTPDVDDLPPVTTVAGSPEGIERAVREWLEILLTPDQNDPPADPRGP